MRKNKVSDIWYHFFKGMGAMGIFWLRLIIVIVLIVYGGNFIIDVFGMDE